MAASLTEGEIREALKVLDAFKSSGITATRLDPQLSSGKGITFVTEEEGWTLK